MSQRVETPFGRSLGGRRMPSRPARPNGVPASSTRVPAARVPAAPAWATRLLLRRRIGDLIAVVAATTVVPVLRELLPGAETSPARDLGVAAALAAAWFLALRLGRQSELRTIGLEHGEALRVLAASAAVFGAFAAVTVFVPIDTAREHLAVSLVTGLGLLAASRILVRRSLAADRSSGRSLQRAVVVGTDADVDATLARLVRSIAPRYVVAGVVRTERGAVADLDLLLDEVVIADAETVILATMPGDGGAFVRELGWRLESTGAQLAIATPLGHVASSRIRLSPIEGSPLLHVDIPSFADGTLRVKRAMDVVLAGAALIVLAPLFLVLAVVIRLDSSGPVFYRQERVGIRGRAFTMVKFRSMSTTAEDELAGLVQHNEGSGPLFKLRHDPRVTRVGRILRRYSLDELPQLWNVFIGDMSLVGPRPPLPSEVRHYQDHVRRRLFVLPGLTGAWQVSGRSDLTWDESVRIDLYYVENWTILRDLLIMLRTIRVVLRPQGAY